MRKILVVFLSVCLLLSGCHKNTNPDTDLSSVTDDKDSTQSGSQGVVKNTEGKNTEASMEEKLLSLSSEWSLVQSLDTAFDDYETPYYEANVSEYMIAEDLSNVENIDKFSGFTGEQLQMLSNNGFVVIPSIDTKINYVYDENEYKGVPNFITSDCALHLYHQFYNKSLMSVELNYLYQDLDMMTKQMLDKSILLLQELSDEELVGLQEQNVIYFLAARMLFTQSEQVTTNVDEKLLKIAKQEYELCQEALGYQESPLFGKDFDYSQFTVRGHYTRSEELEKYFKTMMWFGTAPYVFEEDKKLNYENIYRALLISFTTFAESESICDAKLWSDIYSPTTQYVGLSDDINVFDVNGLRLTVYGDNENPNIFNDDNYKDALEQAVKALPDPQIQAQLETLTTPTGKQFRFMGQRYVLDAEILQELIDNNKRPIPSSLDVMGVLGSNTAEKLLFEVYKPQDIWQKYTENYNALKSKVVSMDTDDWSSNLYSGWLWALQDEIKEYDSGSGMPFFMTTKAWKYKSLNTALGSYTELKHDSVLYAKQAVAEMGGPVDFAVSHYVEPNVELYSKLFYLTENTIALLKSKGMLNDQLSQGAEEYKAFLKLLTECSIKELNNDTLTEEETKQLLWIGGTIEEIIQNFRYGSVENSNIPNDLSDMLVTDISTNLSRYLSLGTGYFDQIYVVVPVEGKLYLTRGAVYSFYEFTSDQRLTDEEWWALNGINKISTEYGDYIELGEPSASLPVQPDWIKYFKSGSNHVMIQSLEVDWDNLNE